MTNATGIWRCEHLENARPWEAVAVVTYRGAVAADDIMDLAGDFEPATQEQWLDAVDKVLRGRDFDAVLRTHTHDGIAIEPLYTIDDEATITQTPSIGASRRASTVAGTAMGWDVRQRHVLGASPNLNAAILHDLSRGVTSIELVTDGSGDVAALDSALADVFLDLAPVGLVSPGSGVADARALLALADQRGVAPSDFVADLGCDPIGQYASSGRSEGSIAAALETVAALAAELASTHPGVRVLRADGGVYAEAGASPAIELATAIATGVTYLRALEAAGVDTTAAFEQIALAVTVGTDQFGDIAKIRALRIMWARVAQACAAEGVTAKVQASTAAALATTRDPWVNMLRVTVGCFAAATAGADVVVVRPFDASIGVPDDLGLRIARNTQLALLEESNLHRVVDPAGGSWYVEHLTDELAAAAWQVFQDIESDGGMVAALQGGTLHRRIDDAWSSTEEAVARRARPITGVSEFPDLDEVVLERPPTPATQPVGGQLDFEPLAPRRLAGAFEDLRDAADAAGGEAAVFLANLGPVAAHTARAAWAKNFFAAGGIRAIDNDGFDDSTELAAAFRDAASPAVVICSSDAVYAENGVAAAVALRDAGAQRIYLAGNPGELRSAFTSAGVDEFIHVGCDVLATLRDVHDLLGLTREATS